MRKIIKTIIKNVFRLPISWIEYYIKLAQKLFENSAASKDEDDIKWIMTKLKVLTHEIDKGLSMPNPRKGFGKQKVLLIMKYLNIYLSSGNVGYEYDAYLDAVEILKKYIQCKDLYGLDVSMIDIASFPVNYTKSMGRISKCHKSDCNDMTKLDFKNFAFDRHSVRFFEAGHVISEEIFEKAVDIARTAPSACNRQPVRVKLVNDKRLAKCILDLQGGTQGFENAENCVLIMIDLTTYWYVEEMNTSFLDAGLFLMNLIYALKYVGIDSCPLIWDDNAQKRKDIDKILDIPTECMITTILAIGVADPKAKMLLSPRRSVSSIII